MKGTLARALVIGLVTLATSAGAGVERAQAGLLTCGQSPEQPFVAWGDYAPYTLAPNGGLESGSVGWSLSGGAKVVAGNEPYRSGSYSLALPSGSSATSPYACVKLNDRAMRFFVLNSGDPDAGLKVEVIYRTALGLLPMTEPVGTIGADGTWQPSPKFGYLANVVGLLSLDGVSTKVRFRFTPRGSGSGFRIDDLFVDPLLLI